MDKLTIPRHALVLVCDGARALLFRNAGDAELVNLETVEHFAVSVPPAHDLGTDRPGRVHQSHGAARSAVEMTDYHAQGEAEFLAAAAAELERVVMADKPKAVFVVAPPRALGVLRERYGAAIRAALSGEIAKDIAHLPTNEIERHLTGRSTL